MSIFFINNHGGGFAAPVDVPAGTRVDELFGQKMPGCKPEDYLIRVNRLPVASDHVLQDGDRVSITPTKVQGAR
jgi:sulfur carrier protein ThiS